MVAATGRHRSRIRVTEMHPRLMEATGSTPIRWTAGFLRRPGRRGKCDEPEDSDLRGVQSV